MSLADRLAAALAEVERARERAERGASKESVLRALDKAIHELRNALAVVSLEDA